MSVRGTFNFDGRHFAAGSRVLVQFPNAPVAGNVTVEAFYRASSRTFTARIYCAGTGTWSWTVVAAPAGSGLEGANGSFAVRHATAGSTSLPGKLRASTVVDRQQLVSDNGRWFLPLGIAGFSFTDPAETGWGQFLIQAEQAGFSRIRAWLRPTAFLSGQAISEDAFSV